MARAGGSRWGLTRSGMAIWTAVKSTRVRTIAGWRRRTSIPTVTPRANAKAAYPMGATPRPPNTSGPISGNSTAARSSAAAHQLTARPHSPPATAAATPMSASLTASQRVRVMLWLHTSRCVPDSSSRVISGAPRRARPGRAGPGRRR
ncbi:hypothetical protein ACFQ0B_01380 [Nonomuraea thailandensis]